MPFSPLRPTISQWCILAVAAIGFTYLFVGLEWNPRGVQTVPDGQTSFVDYLDAASGNLSIEEVAALPDTRWQPWQSMGFTPDRHHSQALWVRVKLHNDSAAPLDGILADGERFADHADCFYPGEATSDAWNHLRSGEWAAAKEKAIWGRDNAFPIHLAPHRTQTIYLHYQDFFGIWLEMVWWPKQAKFYAMQLRSTMAEGLYFGTLLALLFYNAILWIKLRLAPTGSYLLYLGSFTLFMFFGRSTPLLFGWPIGSPWMEALMTAFLAASGVFLLSFAEVFLDLATRIPRSMPWLRGLQALLIFLTLCALVSPFLGLTGVMTLPALGCVVAHVAVFAVAILARRKGAAQASFFVLAIGVLFAGVGPTIPVWLQVLPLRDASLLVMGGSAMEMVLLAVIMSDRIGLLQQEKITAQKALLHEAEQRELLQEAYADDLALEVRERTAELEVSNADKDRILTVLGHDLRSPLTGLTRSAELWAARPDVEPARQHFITEAAQTGRGLLLLIEDLVMWARLRAGTHQLNAHSLGALASPVLALHRPHATAASITLKIAVPEEAMVKTDLVPVQALLRNLLANALKAAHGEVTVEAVQHPDRIEFSIRDDGPGLPLALAAAFASENSEPFPYIHGLGLRLCLEISRALALKLHAQAGPHRGTDFRFSLPIP